MFENLAGGLLCAIGIYVADQVRKIRRDFVKERRVIRGRVSECEFRIDDLEETVDALQTEKDDGQEGSEASAE